MSKEYLPDQEKRILLSALGHEMSLVKENNLTELIPVVRSLDYKFMYDRLFKQIEKNAYEQGRADALTEMIQHIKACENEAYDNVEPIIGSVLMAIRIKAEQLRGDANE